MNTFNAEPNDSELAKLLDPKGRSVSVRVEDTPARLVARPLGYPLWFVVLCTLLPLTAITGYVFYRALRQELQPIEIGLLATGWLGAAPMAIGLVYLVNLEMVSKGDFFVLDKACGTLALPRRGGGLLFRDSQIRGFVEVHAWHTERDKVGSESGWLGELSVLVSVAEGQVARYPVLACEYTDKVTKLADTLAAFFGVERRFVRPIRKPDKRAARPTKE